MQYETGRFSPYGDELYPLLKFLAENGHMDGSKWLKVWALHGRRGGTTTMVKGYSCSVWLEEVSVRCGDQSKAPPPPLAYQYLGYRISPQAASPPLLEAPTLPSSEALRARSPAPPPVAAPGLLLHGISRPPQQELQVHGGELQGWQAVAGERRPVRLTGQCTGQGEEGVR